MLAATTQRLLFETADVEEARDQVARTFADHEMVVRDGRALDLKLDLALAPRVTVGRMSYGTETFIDAPAMRSQYHVNLPLSGRSLVTQNGISRESRAGEAGVALLPAGPFALTWSPEEDQYVIKLRKEHLEAHAARLTGRPSEPIRFELTFDLRSGAAQSLLATAAFVHAELIRPGGVATMPAACHELESALMTQLLMVVPNQLTSLLGARPTSVRRSRIREIIDVIDRDPAAAPTTADLAAMAGVSARALQAGFQEVVGMTPTAYIRGVRLDRVHYELVAGVGGSVTDVAMRWGFYHPSRFAQHYHERFGNLPSETARRRRRSAGDRPGTVRPAHHPRPGASHAARTS
jgi:AraC-like DNA-binding protein